MLGVSVILLIGTARLVVLVPQARADVTNDAETAVIGTLGYMAGRDILRPDEPQPESVLLNTAQRAGLSTQELSRVLVHIATNREQEAFVAVRAINALGILGFKDAFDDLRELSQMGRLEEIRQAAVWSALQLAGRRLIPLAREIRDGMGVPEYHKGAMYRALHQAAGKARSTGDRLDKASEDRRAEVVSFLLESAGKEIRPAGILRFDEILRDVVPEYGVSSEREGFLQKARMLCDEDQQLGKTQKAEMLEYSDKQLETLRRLPPEKRTSVKSWVNPGDGAPETVTRQ